MVLTIAVVVDAGESGEDLAGDGEGDDGEGGEEGGQGEDGADGRGGRDGGAGRFIAAEVFSGHLLGYGCLSNSDVGRQVRYTDGSVVMAVVVVVGSRCKSSFGVGRRLEVPKASGKVVLCVDSISKLPCYSIRGYSCSRQASSRLCSVENGWFVAVYCAQGASITKSGCGGKYGLQRWES